MIETLNIGQKQSNNDQDSSGRLTAGEFNELTNKVNEAIGVINQIDGRVAAVETKEIDLSEYAKRTELSPFATTEYVNGQIGNINQVLETIING